ncbi:MAG: DNA polymerase III subunit gamma/tau [Luteitalea sp.]|nr:DNA polymerase III subunit gamma/tau [Luteitalea sp.]
MTYQVLARKWRPKRFDDVVGQQGVTETLRNAISRNRIAQAFIFAGSRGVGKTTTARILARALNCERGPAPEPCGTCAACIEIAEGRDLDVLEIDAATHTQVDKVREIIIEGLGITPVRDRYKIFIIDEVHQLSSASFNALLKSIEEPPPHVVFMMATTELHKIPETIRSRAQEFELRTVGTRAIAEHLRKIAAAEDVEVDDLALVLLARFAEGSVRDALSAFDQVIAFAGVRITAEQAATVLGLIGRDVLFEVVETVADERAAAVFDLVGRIVEAGQDLRLACKELIGLVRDLMVVQIDPSRLDDPELAADAERLRTLAARFSREDLLRAFDVLARAESEIRYSSQPRYHLEMALLRWMHLRRLVPLTELLDALGGGTGSPRSAVGASTSTALRPAATPRSSAAAPARPSGAPLAGTRPTPPPQPPKRSAAAVAAAASQVPASMPSPSETDDRLSAFTDAVRRHSRMLHGTIVLPAQRIDVSGNVITFQYAASNRVQLDRCRAERQRLEQIASDEFGHAMTVKVVPGHDAVPDRETGAPQVSEQARLREAVMSEPAVKTLLDVFPAEINDVEEIK